MDPDNINGPRFDISVPANSAFIHDTRIELVWEGSNGAGDRFRHVQTLPVTQPTFPLTFSAEKAWLREIAGGNLTRDCCLVVDGHPPVRYGSEPLPLNALDLKQA